jgi:hypothetical protein
VRRKSRWPYLPYRTAATTVEVIIVIESDVYDDDVVHGNEWMDGDE